MHNGLTVGKKTMTLQKIDALAMNKKPFTKRQIERLLA